MSVTISNLLKEPSTSRPLLLRIKDTILGKRYQLSIVFTNAAQMRRLNRAYRKKDTPTDILSFPLSKSEGEIFIAPSVAQREAKKCNRSPQNFLLFLVIHGLLHLKGLAHGSRMERHEVKFRKQFGI